jgi:hypothetical protein
MKRLLDLFCKAGGASMGYHMAGFDGGNQMVGGNEKFYKSVAMGIDWMDPDELNEAIPPGLHIAHR